MIHAPRVLVIIGSVRAQRVCPHIAAWVAQVGREAVDAEFELVDLKDWPLPMDDEPGVPAVQGYALAHTHAWSRRIAEGDAIVFVTPQYNWGYPAALKNALDHLYKEWAGKPAMIVSYGGRGGGKCAEQLAQVLEGLRMRRVTTMPGLVLGRERVEANAGDIDPAEAFADHLTMLKQGFAELASILSGLY